MNKRMYAIWGEKSGQYLTYGGRVIVHDNYYEMQFLFPSERIVEVRGIPFEECLPLPFHPSMEAVQFPLRRNDFKTRN